MNDFFIVVIRKVLSWNGVNIRAKKTNNVSHIAKDNSVYWSFLKPRKILLGTVNKTSLRTHFLTLYSLKFHSWHCRSNKSLLFQIFYRPSWPRSWFVSNSFKLEYSAGFSLKNFKSSENWGRKSGEYSQQHSIMFRTSKLASVGKGNLFPIDKKENY